MGPNKIEKLICPICNGRKYTFPISKWRRERNDLTKTRQNKHQIFCIWNLDSWWHRQGSNMFGYLCLSSSIACSSCGLSLDCSTCCLQLSMRRTHSFLISSIPLDPVNLKLHFHRSIYSPFTSSVETSDAPTYCLDTEAFHLSLGSNIVTHTSCLPTKPAPRV